MVPNLLEIMRIVIVSNEKHNHYGDYMPNTALDREVERRLAEHEVRYTQGRHRVVSTLAAAGGPLSAAEVYEQVDGSLPLSSIYRSLTVLEATGVLAPHNSAKGLTRYELAEWLKGHHHHLVCIECGSVEDVAVTDRVQRHNCLVDTFGYDDDSVFRIFDQIDKGTEYGYQR